MIRYIMVICFSLLIAIALHFIGFAIVTNGGTLNYYTLNTVEWIISIIWYLFAVTLGLYIADNPE